MSHKIIAIKAGDNWELDVLGIPFGGPGNRDKDGEYFDANTSLHADRFGLPAIAYYHGGDAAGRMADRPSYIGKATGQEQRTDGIWYRVVLDKTHGLARRVWDAAQQGLAMASSGTVGHLMRKDADGRIIEWPVAELSLFETDTGKRPVNNYAVALPILKALGIDPADELSTAEADDIDESESVDGKAAWPEGDSTSPAVAPETTDDSADNNRALELLALELEILEMEVI